MLSVVGDGAQRKFRHAYVYKALLVGSVADGIYQLQSYLKERKNPNQNKKQIKEEKRGTEEEKERPLPSGCLGKEVKCVLGQASSAMHMVVSPSTFFTVSI